MSWPEGQAPPYSLRQLEYFVAVAQHGTIVGAAEALRIAPSAVAVALERLEKGLGVQLCVRRKAHGITLTSAGRHLLRPARELLAHAAELHDISGGSAGQLTGALAVGCYLTLAPTVLPLLLETFSRLHPGVSLSFVEGDQSGLEDLLRRGDVDVAVLFDLDLSPDIAAVELCRIRPYVLVPAGHRLAGRGEVTLHDLATDPVILLDQPPSSHSAQRILRSVDVDATVLYRCKGFETTRALVGRGLGWSVLLQRPRTDETYEGRRVSVLEIVDDVPEVRVLLGSARAARSSPAAKALRELAPQLGESLTGLKPR